MIDPTLQRSIMGRFATGVTLLTTRFGGHIWGMTANAVLSLSLDPPLILVAVNRRNQMREHLAAGGCFALNVLTAEQEGLSRHFAVPGPKHFATCNLTTAATGAPVLVDGLAFIDCRIVQVLPGGDHDIFIGEAVTGEARDGEPLVFYDGRYANLVSKSPAAPPGYEALEATYELYGCF